MKFKFTRILAVALTAVALTFAAVSSAAAGVVHHHFSGPVIVSMTDNGPTLTTPDLLAPGTVLSLVGWGPGIYGITSEVADGPVYTVTVTPALPSFLTGDNVNFGNVTPL